MVQTRGSENLLAHITGQTRTFLTKCCIKSCHQVISHHLDIITWPTSCVACAHPDVWSIATEVGSSKGQKRSSGEILPLIVWTESQRTPDQVSCEDERFLILRFFSGSVKRGSCWRFLGLIRVSFGIIQCTVFFMYVTDTRECSIADAF